METFTTVLGTNHGKPRSRIWLEGRRLKDHGFTVGTRYNRSVFSDGDRGNYAILAVKPDGKFKVSGKGDKPIIDMTGAFVRDNFKGERVSITITTRQLVITNPHE